MGPGVRRDDGSGVSVLDQRALVQMQRMPRVLGGFRIVRDHDDRLAVIAVQHLQEIQHVLGRLTIEIAGMPVIQP